MNILIISCGTRNKLVEYFGNRENGFQKVVATDCSEYAPALYEADIYYIVPRMYEPNYLNILLDICKKEKITTILPLQEDELLLISKNRKLFEDNGIMVILSEYETIVLCRDKYAFYEHMKKTNIPSVNTVLQDGFHEDDMDFPVFIKPRTGAGSINSFKVSTMELLNAFRHELEEEYVIQPYVDAVEYGVDAYVDCLSGKLVSVFIKEKLRMRAGETEKSISRVDKGIRKLVEKVVNVIKLKGPVDIDILKRGDELYVLEVNPRFGGGYLHAYECGVNFPKLISVNVAGGCNEERIEEYKEGIVALKYSEILIKDENIVSSGCK